MVNGALKAKYVELWPFNGTGALNGPSCRGCARCRQTSCAIQSHKALETGMTEQLMSVPAISKVPAGSVSGESRGADVGAADGEAAATERGGSIALVLLVAVALVAALSAILTLGGSNAEQ